MLHFKQKKLNFTISCLAFGFKITQEIGSMLIQLRPHSEMEATTGLMSMTMSPCWTWTRCSTTGRPTPLRLALKPKT